MTTRTLRRLGPGGLLSRLLNSPHLVEKIPQLAPSQFVEMIRQIGIEDASEIVALATVEQLRAAFDEELFVSESPGQRERFDAKKFSLWLEILLEAGEDFTAQLIAEMSEDFLVLALSNLLLVLDNDSLLERLGDGGDEAERAEKALESSLCEEIDGYLLIALVPESFDSALTLVLALDKTHRPLLVRVLDRCTGLAERYTEDLEDLVAVLSDSESLAEDVEAEREERRTLLGYVEPRAARAFLKLASTTPESTAPVERDPLTRAYFRTRRGNAAGSAGSSLTGGAPHDLSGAAAGRPNHHTALELSSPTPEGALDLPLVHHLRHLAQRDPATFAERREELSYLANVLLAGSQPKGERLRPVDALIASLLTVAVGIDLEVQSRSLHQKHDAAFEVVSRTPLDLLFRRASAWLVSCVLRPPENAFICTRAEYESALLLSRPSGAVGDGDGRGPTQTKTPRAPLPHRRSEK